MTTPSHHQCQALIFAEDDHTLAQTVQQQLQDAGWWVASCPHFEQALLWIYHHRHHPPHVVLIDIPAHRSRQSMNAFKFYGFVRNGGWVAAVEQRFAGWGETVPIFMLIDVDQRFEVEERMYALGVQPDRIDYKPYHPHNLLNKLNGLAKRESAATVTQESAILRVRSLVIDTEQESVLLEGRALKLSQLEYRLLFYLTSHLDIPLTREQLLADIWGITGIDAVNNRNVDVYIGKLRKKLAGSDCADLIERGRNGTYLLKSPAIHADRTVPEAITNLLKPESQPLPAVRLIRESQDGHLPKIIDVNQAAEQVSLQIGVKLGRSSQQCDIVLSDQRISRRHATLFAAQEQFYLRDENSTGHTYLEQENGEGKTRTRIAPHETMVLMDGDVIYFNTVAYRFDLG